MDALVRELNKLGYQPVFLPQTDLEPPELYNYSPKQRRLVRRGPLADYFPSNVEFRVLESTLSDIRYKYTSDKNIGATASFLENSLRCVGIDALPKLDLKFAGSKSFSFAFTDVKCRRLAPSQVDLLIKELQIGAIPHDIVEADRLHIVYEYAYANELLMSRSDRKAFSEDVSSKVGDFIDIGTKGSITVASESTISFKGASGQQAAFAFKAGYLSREDGSGRWEFHAEEMHKADADAAPYILAPGVVLTLEGDC